MERVVSKQLAFRHFHAHRLTLPALFFAAISSNAAFAAIAPGDLTITEVMANPASVSDTRGEWFEIYNSSSMALDLEGLSLRDEGSNQHTIAGPLIIGAGNYLVLGRNADSSVNGGYSADYQYSNFTLSNSSDQIILEFGGVVIDRVSYNDSSIFGIAGVSAELTSNGFAPTPDTFAYGDGDIGTPGSAGSDPAVVEANPSPVPLPGSGWLMASGLCGLFTARRRQRS